MKEQDKYEQDSTWLERTGGFARDMTLRDYFAAQTLSVVLKKWTDDAKDDGMLSLLEEDGTFTEFAICIAEEVYAMADAMLKERNK